MYAQMILRAQFVDRAGRTVFLATPLQIHQDENGQQMAQEGPPAFTLRMELEPGEDGEVTGVVEWLPQPEAPAVVGGAAGDPPAGGFVPGQVPDPEEPGPHSGGTG